MATLTIGTRGSKLALVQTDLTAQALKRADPTLEIKIRVIETHGDQNQNPIPLDTIGKGWFTKEIEEGLLKKEIDLAVHSLKDLAEEMPAELTIAAYLPREDARDVLITKQGESLEELKQGAIIGTDSTRRSVQIKALRPDLVVQSLRGNVPTRVQKLQTEQYDAIILAAAGLKRLGMADKITRYFEPYEMTPAPGQGILAVQTRADTSSGDLIRRINDKKAATAAELERTFSAKHGGGCKSPTGAYAWCEGSKWYLLGMTEQNGKIMRETHEI